MDRFGCGAWTPEGCDTNDEAFPWDPAVHLYYVTSLKSRPTHLFTSSHSGVEE